MDRVWEQIQGEWIELKQEVQWRWKKLTDDDFELIQGERDKLISCIHQYYGGARHEIARQVDKWSNRHAY